MGAQALCGCTLLLEYPAPEAEVCDNDIDDDFDGRTDCDDPDCDSPSCVEVTREQCTDGRDNDGDGRFDAHDVRCWPFADIEIERCLSTAGTAWEPSMSRDAGWSGAVRGDLEPIFARPILWLPSDGSQIEHPQALTGELDGTELVAEVYLDPLEAYLQIELVPRASESPVPVQIELGLGPWPDDVPMAWLQVRRPGSPQGILEGNVSRIVAHGSAGWYRIELRIIDGYVSAVAIELATERASLPVRQEIPRASRAPTSYRFRARSRSADAPAALGYLRVDRPRRDPCGAPVPAELSGVLPGRARRLDSVALGSDGMLCALAHIAGDATISSWRSRDEGLRWERGGLLPLQAVGAAIAFDPSTGAFRGMAREEGYPEMAVDGEYMLLDSIDCRTWETRAVGDDGRTRIFPGESFPFDHIASYRVLGRRHEALIQGWAPTGVAGLRSALPSYVSDDDAVTGSFVRSNDTVLLASLELDEPVVASELEVYRESRFYAAYHAGGDTVLLHGRLDGTVRVYVTTDRIEWVEVEALRLAPSGHAGTLDAELLGGPLLSMSEVPEPGAPWRGQIFIQGANPSPFRSSAIDVTTMSPGWGVLRVTVR